MAASRALGIVSGRSLANDRSECVDAGKACVGQWTIWINRDGAIERHDASLQTFSRSQAECLPPF